MSKTLSILALATLLLSAVSATPGGASGLSAARSIKVPRLLRRQREQPPACTATEPECGPFCLQAEQECCGGGGNVWYYCLAGTFCFKDTLSCCPDGSTDEECEQLVTPVVPPPTEPTTVTDEPTAAPTTETITDEFPTTEPTPPVPEITTEEPTVTVTGTGVPIPSTNGTVTTRQPTVTPPPENTGAAVALLPAGGVEVAMGMGAFVAWVVGAL